MHRTSVWLVAALTAGLAASCTKADNASVKLKQMEDRIATLEAEQKKLAEVAEFVRPIMAQQQAQQAEQDSREPDPAARFAVDVTGSAYDGPASAAVTIVEAFDFA